MNDPNPCSNGRPRALKSCPVCEGTGIICSSNVESGPLGTRPELCTKHKVCEIESCLMCNGDGFVNDTYDPIDVAEVRFPDYTEVKSQCFDFSIMGTEDLLILIDCYKEALKKKREFKKPKTEEGRQLHSEMGACIIIANTRQDLAEA